MIEQGAWRMRGLAMGQRIEVLMTPEVARLVREAMAATPTDKQLTPLALELPCGSDPSVVSSTVFDTKATHAGISAERDGLCQVAAWLVLSGAFSLARIQREACGGSRTSVACGASRGRVDTGLGAEQTQHFLLLEHRARHVWRQHAFATVHARHAAVGRKVKSHGGSRLLAPK
jgi:hypothetical protein